MGAAGTCADFVLSQFCGGSRQEIGKLRRVLLCRICFEVFLYLIGLCYVTGNRSLDIRPLFSQTFAPISLQGFSGIGFVNYNLEIVQQNNCVSLVSSHFGFFIRVGSGNFVQLFALCRHVGGAGVVEIFVGNHFALASLGIGSQCIDVGGYGVKLCGDFCQFGHPFFRGNFIIDSAFSGQFALFGFQSGVQISLCILKRCPVQAVSCLVLLQSVPQVAQLFLFLHHLAAYRCGIRLCRVHFILLVVGSLVALVLGLRDNGDFVQQNVIQIQGSQCSGQFSVFIFRHHLIQSGGHGIDAALQAIDDISIGFACFAVGHNWILYVLVDSVKCRLIFSDGGLGFLIIRESLFDLGFINGYSVFGGVDATRNSAFLDRTVSACVVIVDGGLTGCYCICQTRDGLLPKGFSIEAAFLAEGGSGFGGLESCLQLRLIDHQALFGFIIGLFGSGGLLEGGQRIVDGSLLLRIIQLVNRMRSIGFFDFCRQVVDEALDVVHIFGVRLGRIDQELLDVSEARSKAGHNAFSISVGAFAGIELRDGFVLLGCNAGFGAFQRSQVGFFIVECAFVCIVRAVVFSYRHDGFIVLSQLILHHGSIVRPDSISEFCDDIIHSLVVESGGISDCFHHLGIGFVVRRSPECLRCKHSGFRQVSRLSLGRQFVGVRSLDFSGHIGIGHRSHGNGRCREERNNNFVSHNSLCFWFILYCVTFQRELRPG